jgi:CheY-like chemotaxis protein
MTDHRAWEILLVEDTAADAELVRVALREVHPECVVRHVLTGEEALGLLQSGETGRRIGLVLLDLNLPGMSGVEVLDQIRTDASLRRLPVIALTTSDNEEEVRRLYDSRANAFVVKPLGLTGYRDVLGALHCFWADTARIPARSRGAGTAVLEREVM